VQRLSQLRLYLLHGITYSSDGRGIVYSTTRLGSRVLMRWDRDSAQVQPLGLEGSAPARTADGGLVYALMRAHVSVAQLDAGGAAPMRLINSVGTDREPVVDRAGARVVFVSRRSGHPELWQAGLDGSAPSALTQLEGVVATPAVAPLGGDIAFLGSCGPGKRFGLCLRPGDGGAPRPLAADAANYGRPAWHPTAPEVWVASDRGERWQLWRFPLDGSPGTPVATDSPPRALQWAADGSGFVYQPRLTGDLRWHPAAPGGAERLVTAMPTGQTLVNWRLSAAGLRLLTRGEKERFVHVELASGRADTLSEHALGTFPEQASFDLRADGGVLVELSDSGSADLMLAR
jgi:Tol biopolymer transport system component